MPRKRIRNPRLVDRDYDILEHLARYRLTTREVLHRLFFSDSELNAVTKVTSRLTEHGFLNKYPLAPARNYFVIGPTAAKLFGVSPKKCKPIGPQALPQEYATLLFCCMQPVRRERLLVSQMQEKFPDLLARKIDNSHYYLDQDQNSAIRLAYLRVDQGGTRDHIARKCEKDIQDRKSIGSFRNLIETDRFMITVLTARDEKAKLIRETLAKRSWPVRFRVEAIEDLTLLITRSFEI